MGISGKSRFSGVRKTETKPAVVNPSPAPLVNTGGGGGIMSNLMSSAVMGVGLGAGSEVGHRLVGKLMDCGKEERVLCDRDRLDVCLREGGECVDEMREFMRCLEKGAK